ncbi:MAG: serine O-acetyltransferase [Clostridiaceae bacterium]|nr:serine O-acetyltransferase [Clostridiaceae bacterium]
MFKKLREDINTIMQRDPAATNIFQVLLLYPGLKAVRSHRRANWLYKHKLYFLARYISERCKQKTGIEIHPAAEIGMGLFIDHGTGVVIGETTIIGDNCTIYQGVTLGGTGKDKGKRHPTIGNNVTIGAGAKVLGPFCVGDNSKIAANAVVLSEVPANSTCVGVPGRIVKIDNKRVKPNCDLDHIHIPDPISIELCKIINRLEKLEHKEEAKDETI